MQISKTAILITALVIMISCSGPASVHSITEPVPVRLIKENGEYQLERDGKPFYIYGAGGQMYMDLVKQHGGNSIRLWSTTNENQESGMTISAILDSAHAHQLTVTLGLWVTHPRHNRTFYDDDELVEKQLEKFRKDVNTYKNHPALLMWAVGNEVHLNSDDLRVWDAVGEIAEMIHVEDPDHPVSTITAGISKETVDAIKTRAPGIELIGVNQYDNDLSYLPAKVRAAGWEKAYFVGEYGPGGPWKVDRTPWGGRYEPLQEEKMNAYIQAFRTFRQDSTHCIGSYAFKWGWKWEKTYSWFNFFTHDGKEVVTTDALEYVWTGSWPENRGPVSGEIQIDDKKARDLVKLNPGTVSSAKVTVRDAENDLLHFKWILYPETNSKARGGDPETPETAVEVDFGKQQENTIAFTAPEKEGAYRLYVFVSDENNRVSISNIPFYVEER